MALRTLLTPHLPPGIVISASPASESTSSDSCLPYLASEGPGVPSGHLAAQELLGTCSPLRLASPLLGTQSATPVLEAPGGPALHPVSFQEGRRASDTSLTQGVAPALTPPMGPLGGHSRGGGPRP